MRLQSGIFYVPFCLNGVETFALVDTGANSTSIDVATAKALNMHILSYRQGFSLDVAGNKSPISETYIKKLSIGEYEIDKMYASVFYGEDVVRAPLLGLDTLILHNAIIDIGNRKLYLQK